MKSNRKPGRALFHCLLVLFAARMQGQQLATVTADCNDPPVARANVAYRHTLTFSEAGVAKGWTRQAASWSLLSRSDTQLSLADRKSVV